MVLCFVQEVDREQSIFVVNSPVVESQVHAQPAANTDRQQHELTDRKKTVNS